MHNGEKMGVLNTLPYVPKCSYFGEKILQERNHMAHHGYWVLILYVLDVFTHSKFYQIGKTRILKIHSTKSQNKHFCLNPNNVLKLLELSSFKEHNSLLGMTR